MDGNGFPMMRMDGWFKGKDEAAAIAAASRWAADEPNVAAMSIQGATAISRFGHMFEITCSVILHSDLKRTTIPSLF